MKEILEELLDEAEDFFEDFSDHLLRKEPKLPVKKKPAVIGGVAVVVRPAYLFAERIDNVLRILFGVSIIVSALTASFLGFSTLSVLLEALIFTFWGRIIMFLIGGSYLIIAIWKLMHLNKSS